MENQKIKCPKCGKNLDIDSVREHKDGRKRIYWECRDCNLSIMDRGKQVYQNFQKLQNFP